MSEFFKDCDMEQYEHDGSTRKWWVVGVLEEILKLPLDDPALPGAGFQKVIQVLMERTDHTDEDPKRQAALSELNKILARERLGAFYAEDNLCYIRDTATGKEGRSGPVVDRALSKDESSRRVKLEHFIKAASEDSLTEKVMLPLLQTLGFQRISITGHRDKTMEFGKDIWMKYHLPTRHWLYFGLQVKRGKIDSAAQTKKGNVAEVYHQSMMLLGYEIFDPDINKKRLVDHAIIVAGGEITKQAKHWLGGKLDASQRSQIMFMDRADIMHLFVVHNVPIPEPDKEQAEAPDDRIPF